MSALTIATVPTPASGLTAAATQDLWRQSLNLYNRGDYQKARDILLRLTKAYPTKAIYWFNLGNAYFMLKQFPPAETSFYRVETLQSPLTPAARVYRAKALLERGETEAAARLLDVVLSTPNLPPAIHDMAVAERTALQPSSVQEDGSPNQDALVLYRAGKFKRALRVLNRQGKLDDNMKMLKALILIRLDRDDGAEQLLKGLEKSESSTLRRLAQDLRERMANEYTKSKWLFLDLAAGRDSNPDPVHDSTAEGVITGLIGGGGRIWSENLWYLTAGYSLKWRDVFRRQELRTVRHEAKANLGRELANELILLSPFFSHESWDSEARRWTSGLAARWRTGVERFEVGVDAEWTSDRALESDSPHLTGTSQHYIAYAGTVFAPVYGRLFVRAERQDTGDLVLASGGLVPYAYRAIGSGAALLWRIKSDWTAELIMSYVGKDYPTPPTLGPRREDREYALSTRITKTLSPELALYGSLAARKNKSTLGAGSVSNENYDETLILAGVTWDAI